MNKEIMQLLSAFYYFGNQINPTTTRVTSTCDGHGRGYRDISLEIESDSISIATTDISSSYKAVFKQNEITIKMSYYYRSYDDDIRREKEGNLTIRNNELVYNHHHDENEDTYRHTTKVIDGPMSDEQVKKIINIISDVVTKLVPPSKLQAYHQQRQFESYYTVKQALLSAARNSNDPSNGFEFMADSNVAAELFNNFIGPLSGVAGLSKDQVHQYDALSTSFNNNSNHSEEKSRPAPVNEKAKAIVPAMTSTAAPIANATAVAASAEIPAQAKLTDIRAKRRAFLDKVCQKEAEPTQRQNKLAL